MDSVNQSTVQRTCRRAELALGSLNGSIRRRMRHGYCLQPGATVMGASALTLGAICELDAERISVTLLPHEGWSEWIGAQVSVGDGEFEFVTVVPETGIPIWEGTFARDLIAQSNPLRFHVYSSTPTA